MELIFLGTGAGNGVPEFYCGCRVCAEAAQDPRCRRSRSAIAICGEGNLLFDAPPELSAQLLREKIDRVDALFITHAHHDHYAGLGDLEIYMHFFRKEKLPAVMSSETFVQLENRFGSLGEWMDITFIEPGQTIERCGVGVTALDVSHSPGSLGFLIHHNGRRTAYLPDTGPLPLETRDQLLDAETLILDATFWEENLYPDVHHCLEDTIKTAIELNVGTLFMTHLSMHYGRPVTSGEIERSIEHHMGRVRLAYDGTRISMNSSAL